MTISRKHTRLQALRRQVARLERRLQWLEGCSRRYGQARMALVLVGLCSVLGLSRLYGATAGWLAIGGTVVLFAGVVARHSRVQDSLRRHVIWLRLKSAHIARLTLDWEHILASPLATPSADHPFATDLNVLGQRSLYQLLDTTMSQEGSARLRSWLLQPLTVPAEVQARQACVRELLSLVTFRDRLALYGTLVTQNPQGRWQGEIVRQWLGRALPARSLWPWIVVLGVLAGSNITLGVLYALGFLPAWWFFSFVLYLALYQHKHQDVRQLFAEAFRLDQTLQQFGAVLLYLETYHYRHVPRLATLCAPFWQARRRPSAVLRQLARLAGAASVQQSNLVGPLVNMLVPWDLYFMQRLEQCKAEVREELPVWLDTWYELEALNALAHFGYVNPDYVFPTVRAPEDAPEAPLFRAQQLGHPLLPHTVQVCNDFTMQQAGDLVIITGSNMSGKSTFLRTVGLNLCLAFNGAPVHATCLQTVPLRLFTCITVSDSVVDGISYFYAEVQRLKALLTALTTPHPWPVLYLIDEIFRGTNNRERLLGSRAYIQALAGSPGLGLVSTHDLELVTLEQEVKGLRNMHFRDTIVAGRMVFDYTLRSGPCPTTNALTIMQLEGLPVPPETVRGAAVAPSR